MFKHYKNKIKNQLNKKIKLIKSDKGGKNKHHLVNLFFLKWYYSPNYYSLFTITK
jgi:hypothetical protein